MCHAELPPPQSENKISDSEATIYAEFTEYKSFFQQKPLHVLELCDIESTRFRQIEDFVYFQQVLRYPRGRCM